MKLKASQKEYSNPLKGQVHHLCRMIFPVLLVGIVVVASGTHMALADVDAPLKPWVENPFYWSWNDKPILLLGGSDDDNLFQWPEAKLIPQLDRLAEAGGNVIRNTMSDRKDGEWEIYAYKQLENGSYDLMQWNDAYWDRFECMLRETAARSIFVQIEVWDRFDFTDSGNSNRWKIHPYNPTNNINYNGEESGLDDHYPDHPGRNRQPFFFTTPEQQNNTVLLPYQQRFVEKMLEHSLKYDHVLYCMDNETNGDEAWGQYWAKFIRERAEKAGKRVYLTEMWDKWDLTSSMHKRTFDHPELYDFVDVSQNNHKTGQEHWDNFLHVREYLSSLPRPMNTTKTYGADGNKFGHTDQDGIERFWRHLLAGAASMRFHRPDAGIGLNDKAVAAIRAARMLESKIPLWTLKPANALLSDRDDNEAYAAADPGRAYALYFPAGGAAVSLDLSAAKGKFTLYWINIDTGAWGAEQKVKGGKSIALNAPDDGNWAIACVSRKK